MGSLRSNRRSSGFTMIELVLVVAVIGVLSAIAVPSYMGAQRHARVVGDAQANARVLQMLLETARAEQGLYPPAGTYVWKSGAPLPAGNPAPAFAIQGTSKMAFTLVINDNRLTYQLTAANPENAADIYHQTDQTGATLK